MHIYMRIYGIYGSMILYAISHIPPCFPRVILKHDNPRFADQAEVEVLSGQHASESWKDSWPCARPEAKLFPMSCHDFVRVLLLWESL